ncbi:hypothetical protein [Hyphomonas sp.]|uniref:DUF7483 domain-containing protein n=1 Tax=Hyphomonas sp. TaxID=87 RepID=UPI0025BCC616|nr:hypothetical protein [Hyphomonas sp.]
MAAYTTIDDSSAHFQATTYTGAGLNQTVTNGGNSDLQPDWLWIKNRTAGYAHALFDSNRGLGSSNPPMLESDSNNAENSNQNWISAVGTDSFTIGVNEHNLSNSGSEYVAWQWKAAGGTTASNSNGSITSTVQANTTAGFSIVTYTGDGATSATVGHGLGAVPKMIISKERASLSNVTSWRVYHQDIGNTKYIQLDTSGAAATFDDWGNTTPTSTVYTIGGSGGYRPTNTSSRTYVAYVFAEKQGYSKFGKYIGNGNSDGPFIYTGFKPAFVIVKATGGTTDWRMNGPDGVFLSANTTAAVYDSAPGPIDRVSNGFKIRGGDDLRANGGTFIYMAWAKNPFVTSTGVPTTASNTGPAT